MSSIFNYSGLRSPPRRPIPKPSPTSPFCTSPSQLQEVTLDPDASLAYSVGLRSPGGPLRGRSVKEFEEQLTNLRKENFNLKLRIYFLEERMGSNFNVDQESAVKKNIELMVELESAKKELQEKQDLLCQAVKAMELEEDEHKKDADLKEKQYHDIRQRYEILQQQYEDEIRSQGDNNSTRERELYCQAFNLHDNSSEELIKDLELKINGLETQLREEKDTVNKLNTLLQYTEMHNSEGMKVSLDEKEFKIQHLEQVLDEKNDALFAISNKMSALSGEYEEKVLEIVCLQKELDGRNSEVNDLLNEVDTIKRVVEETNELLRSEQKKCEKSKVAITNRNGKINELELEVEKFKKRSRNLETRLETAQNEVKGKTEELDTYLLRSPIHKSFSSDVDSFLVRSTPSSANNSSKSLSRLATQSPPTHLKQTKKSPNSCKLIKSATTNTMQSITASKELIGIEEDINKILVPYVEGDVPPEKRELHRLVQELKEAKKTVWGLESNQLKACRVIQAMLDSRKKQAKEIEELTTEMKRRDELIGELRAAKHNSSIGKSISTITDRISELNLTAAAPASDVEQSMVEGAEDPKILLEQYKTLTNELDTQKQLLLDTLKAKEEQMSCLQVKYSYLKEESKLREEKISTLEFEAMSNEVHKQMREKSADDCSKDKVSYFVQESAEKDKEIERLESELKKRTIDLQGLVNNELWDKNREIEKIQKRFNTMIETKDKEIVGLKNDIIGKDQQLHVLKEKIDEIGNSSLKNYSISNSHELAEGEDLESRIAFLLEDREKLLVQIEEAKLNSNNLGKLDELRDELKRSEHLRGEANEISQILSTRLEELAQFLESLLNKKSVLGFLGQKQNNRLRNYVDQSLDLSRSLSMSITMNPDQSLMQLTNISNLLNTTRLDRLSVNELFQNDEENNCILSIVPDNVTLTYQSHLHLKNTSDNGDKTHIISVLRAQVENLKREIELRDVELGNKLSVQNDDLLNAIVDLELKDQRVLSPENILENLMDVSKSKLNTTSTTLKHLDLSDSESWSEPDRDVSKARIGVSLQPVKRRNMNESTESAEFTLETRPLSRTPSKKSLDNRQTISALTSQICELENKLKEQENDLLKAQAAYFEVDNEFKKEQLKFEEGRAQREQLLKRIAETEGNLITAEAKKIEAETQVQHLQIIIRELQLSKDDLLECMESKSKTIQNKLNELERDRLSSMEAASKAEIELIEAQKEIKVNEQRLAVMHQEMLKADTQLRMEAAERLCKAESEFETKVKTIELKTQEQIYKITDAANQLQIKYENEYVKRTEIEQLKEKLKELETIEIVLQVAEEKIGSLEEIEAQLKEKLHESEKEHHNLLNELRREIDHVNLQYSEAYLQKTQIENEKIMLEGDMQSYKENEVVFIRQVSELKREFAQMNDTLQKQVTNLNLHKHRLELTVGDLEAANIELRSKLICNSPNARGAEQTSPVTPATPSSPAPSKILELYLSKNSTQRESLQRQVSDLSDYNSEDQNNLNNPAIHQMDRSRFRFDEQLEDNERNHGNSSPDLGIESDHGRFSSLEANQVVHRPFLKNLEITNSMSNMLSKSDTSLVCSNNVCCAKSQEVIRENDYLRKKLLSSRNILKDTAAELLLANHKKREVEKTICKQIYKTSQVLRKAKNNLDSGSESDITRK